MIKLAFLNILVQLNCILNLKEGYYKTIKNILNFAEDCLVVYEIRIDYLFSNLRLDEFFTLSFFPISVQKKKRNKLETVLGEAYGLHLNKYLNILGLIQIPEARNSVETSRSQQIFAQRNASTSRMQGNQFTRH